MPASDSSQRGMAHTERDIGRPSICERSTTIASWLQVVVGDGGVVRVKEEGVPRAAIRAGDVDVDRVVGGGGGGDILMAVAVREL